MGGASRRRVYRMWMISSMSRKSSHDQRIVDRSWDSWKKRSYFRAPPTRERPEPRPAERDSLRIVIFTREKCGV